MKTVKNVSQSFENFFAALWDPSKAFDSISHDILIEKLQLIGLDSDAKDLINSFLSNRLQRVKLDSIYSSWIKIAGGVPPMNRIGAIFVQIVCKRSLYSY